MSLANGIPEPKQVADEPKYRCGQCKDLGWYESNQRRYSRCDCQVPNPEDGSTLREHLQHTGMESEEIELAMTEWDGSVESRLRQGSLAIAHQWGGGSNEPRTLTFFGVPGSGKTLTAAHCVAEYLYSGGSRVRWVHVPTATREYLAMQPSQRRDRDREIQICDLCVFDEAGATKDQFSDIWMGWFFALMRTGRRIIITSNASTIKEFEGRVASRLKTGFHGTISNEDYRG